MADSGLSIELELGLTDTVLSLRLLRWCWLELRLWLRLLLLIDVVLDIHAVDVLDVRKISFFTVRRYQLVKDMVYLTLILVSQCKILINILISEFPQCFETLMPDFIHCRKVVQCLIVAHTCIGASFLRHLVTLEWHTHAWRELRWLVASDLER